jgi:hypothetical protein
MTSQRGGSPWFAILLGLFFTGLGGGIAWYGQKLIDRASQSTDWPKATGVVLSSKVQSKREKGKLKYWAEVKYEFTVNGEKRIGSTISFGSYRSSSPRDFEPVVSRYPVGKEVPVYHDPNDPGINVLEPGLTGGARVPQIIGLIFLGIGLAMVGYRVIVWAASRPEPPEVLTIE